MRGASRLTPVVGVPVRLGALKQQACAAFLQQSCSEGWLLVWPVSPPCWQCAVAACISRIMGQAAARAEGPVAVHTIVVAITAMSRTRARALRDAPTSVRL